MTWIDNLQDIDKFELNETLINNSDNIIPGMVSNANATAGFIWYYMVIFVIWIFLIYIFFRKDQPIALDITRSVFFSSSWTLILSVGLVMSDLVTNIMPTIWLTIIWVITGLLVFELQRKNQ